MSTNKDIKRRAKALGWKPDGAGRWTKQVGTHEEDGRKIVGILTTAQLADFLDQPPLPADLSPLPNCPAPSGRLRGAESEGANKHSGAGHREGVSA